MKSLKKMMGMLVAVAMFAMVAHASTITLTQTNLVAGGLAATYTGSLTAADTYRFVNDGKKVLHFEKTQANACTVTITTTITAGGGLAVSDEVVSVPASSGDIFIGPFPPSIYNDGSGYVSFTLSEESGLTVAVLSLP